MNKLFFFIYFILFILISFTDLKSNQSNENILEADKIEYINESGKISGNRVCFNYKRGI